MYAGTNRRSHALAFTLAVALGAGCSTVPRETSGSGGQGQGEGEGEGGAAPATGGSAGGSSLGGTGGQGNGPPGTGGGSGGATAADDAGVGAPDGPGAPDDPGAGVSDPGNEGDGNVMMTGPYDYPAEATLQPGVTAGKLIDVPIAGKIFAGRTVQVYVPSGYVDKTPAPFLVLQDGPAYVTRFKLPTVLDNLIAKKQLPLMLAIFVPNGGGKRSVEYDTLSDAYVRFVLEEVLPAVEAMDAGEADHRSAGAAPAATARRDCRLHHGVTAPRSVPPHPHPQRQLRQHPRRRQVPRPRHRRAEEAAARVPVGGHEGQRGPPGGNAGTRTWPLR